MDKFEVVIFDRTGQTVRYTVRELEYSDTFMGACHVTVTVKSPSPVPFSIGDYLVYRGERFELNYIPEVKKQARSGSAGDAFVYDDIRFDSLSDELTRCMFLDVVPGDNHIHYTSLPSFSFYASTIEALAERIQANLDRVYTGDKRWTVTVHSEYADKTGLNISINNNTVWEALGLANSKFGANFVIKGRTITIGTSGIPADMVFEYGKDKGLTRFTRTAESDQSIITRLYVYGSERNLPARYYNKKYPGISNQMAVTRLMLPSFPDTDYIDSPNIATLGIREGTVFFDGSDDELEEIFPSLEGMTSSTQGALDEVLEAEQITDDGTAESISSEDVPPFTITLKDIGFDLNEYLGEDAATISMKSGMCGAREFEILSCVRTEDGTSGWVLTCNRVYDDGLQLYFPNNSYNISSGDKFVLLNIEMPDAYVEDAARRLQEAGEAYLAKYDYIRYSYIPEIDNVKLARQHDTAVKNGETSIHDTIKAGDLMLFEDSDLRISGSILIDQLSIKEGDGYIPKYDLTLREEKTVGTIEDIQNQIDSIVSGGQGGGGYTAVQIQQLIRTYGTRLFLRKDIEDIAQKTITFLKGILLGDYEKGVSGGAVTVDESTGRTYAEFDEMLIRMAAAFLKGITIGNYNSGALGAGGCFRVDENGDTYIEADRMLIRKVATFVQLMIQELKHVGGQIVLSPASMTCSRVEEYEDYYRCYFENTDGEKSIEQEFVAGDQARCQTFNIKEGTTENASNVYYWRLVTGVGDNYIDLSKTDCDAESTVPQAGDEIVQVGNRTDATRQSAIILSAYGVDAPSLKFYHGIDSFSLDGKATTYFTSEGNRIVGEFVSTASGKTLDQIAADIETVKQQSDQQYVIWFGTEIPTLENYPASDWAEANYTDHVEDLYYLDNEADEANNGRAWRFVQNEDGTFAWTEVTDKYILQCITTALGAKEEASQAKEDATQAKEDAAGAKEEAQQKRRVFVSQPTDASVYDVGDLWVKATYQNADGTYMYSDDTLVCKTAKAAGEAFSITHWWPASYATTANIINTGESIRLEVESKINTVNDKIDGLNDGLVAAEKRISSIELDMEGISATVEKVSFDKDGNITNIDKTGLLLEDDFASLLASKITFDTDGNVTNYSKSGLVTTENFASVLAEHITTDENGNVTVDTSGLVTKSEFATLFSEKVKENNLVARSELETYVTDDDLAGLKATVENIRWDADGNITNISTSGLVLENNFASLFVQEVNKEDSIVATKAEISLFITEDELNNKISNLKISADQIEFLGKTIINGNFVVDESGNLTINGEINATSGTIGGWVIGKTLLRSEEYTYPKSLSDADGVGSFLKKDGIMINCVESNGVLDATTGQQLAAYIGCKGDYVSGITGAYIVAADTNTQYSYLSEVTALELRATNAYNGVPNLKPLALKVTAGFCDIPGVLLAGYVYKDGSAAYRFGKQGVPFTASRSGVTNTYEYTIKHSIGHQNYVVMVTPFIATDWKKVHAVVTSRLSTSFTVKLIDSGTDNDGEDQSFFFVAIGDNVL